MLATMSNPQLIFEGSRRAQELAENEVRRGRAPSECRDRRGILVRRAGGVIPRTCDVPPV